jgi:hypothetical protein
MEAEGIGEAGHGVRTTLAAVAGCDGSNGPVGYGRYWLWFIRAARCERGRRYGQPDGTDSGSVGTGERLAK